MVLQARVDTLLPFNFRGENQKFEISIIYEPDDSIGASGRIFLQ